MAFEYECNVSSVQAEMATRFREIRQRLNFPSNAKPDLGISLNRPHGILGAEAEKNARIAALLAHEAATKAAEKARIEEALARLERERKAQFRISTLASRRAYLDNSSNPLYTQFPQNFLHHIKQQVAIEFEIKAADIDHGRKTIEFVYARHAAWFISYNLTAKSLPEIGRAFGDRDHTSIMFAVRTFPKKLSLNAEFCHRVVFLQAKIEFDLEEWRRAGARGFI